MKKFFLLFLALGCTSARANFTAIVDAGQITGKAGGTITKGSLLLLVAAGPDGVFSPVTAGTGTYVSGDDIVLAAAPFNTSGGTNETNNLFSANLNATSGQEVALLWFPSVQYGTTATGGTATYQTAVLTNTTSYGEYSPRVSNPANLLLPTAINANTPDNPDGGSKWLVPTGGAINLDFFTTNSDGGGTQLQSEGLASNLVLTGVPEPSCGMSVGASLLALTGLRVWKRRGLKATGLRFAGI